MEICKLDRHLIPIQVKKLKSDIPPLKTSFHTIHVPAVDYDYDNMALSCHKCQLNCTPYFDKQFNVLGFYSKPWRYIWCTNMYDWSGLGDGKPDEHVMVWVENVTKFHFSNVRSAYLFPGALLVAYIYRFYLAIEQLYKICWHIPSKPTSPPVSYPRYHIMKMLHMPLSLQKVWHVRFCFVWVMWTLFSIQLMFLFTSYISRTFVGHKIVYQSNVIGAACRRCSNYVFIIDLTPGSNCLGRCNCKKRRETFKYWDLFRLT